MYGLRAFLDTYLNYNVSAKYGYLSGFGWYKDAEKTMDTAANPG